MRKVTIHPAALESDIILDAAVPLTPESLRPVNERKWVADSYSTSGGHYEDTGSQLHDADGHPLFSIPVRAARATDGLALDPVVLQLRQLTTPIPARVALVPTGNVEIEFGFARGGRLVITCDTVRPVAAHRGGADNE